MEFKNKKIDIFGEKYTIRYHDTVVFKDNEGEKWVYGQHDGIKNTIDISTQFEDGTKLSDTTIEQSVCHELAHAILYSGMYYDENANEQLVEWVGKCLRQIIKSKIF